MSTIPQMRPCPKCGTADNLTVYRYENGWRHVECNKCYYLGPGAGSIRGAIKSHNEWWPFDTSRPMGFNIYLWFLPWAGDYIYWGYDPDSALGIDSERPAAD